MHQYTPGEQLIPDGLTTSGSYTHVPLQETIEDDGTPGVWKDDGEAMPSTAESLEAAPPVSSLDVRSDKFNAIMGIVIVTNAVLISLETDYGSEGSTELFASVENVYTAIFTVEMTMRMCQLGADWCKDTWNLFDFVLVSFSVVNLIVAAFLHVDGSQSSSKASMVRLCRLLRVLRILRLFRMFHDLLLILRAFERAIKVVMWLGLLILLLDWMCAIALTQGVGHNAHLWAPLGEEEAILKWFGNIRCSMQSLFIIMTLAEWDDMAYTLIEVLPPVPVFVGFMVYILICSYTMVSLITGIISESLVSAQQADTANRMKEIEEERSRFASDLKDIMIALDDNCNGYIDHEEVEQALVKYPSIFTRLAALDINIDLRGILAIVDRLSVEGKGVQIHNLVDFMTNLSGHAKAPSIIELKYELKAMMQENHENMLRYMTELVEACNGAGPTGAAEVRSTLDSHSLESAIGQSINVEPVNLGSKVLSSDVEESPPQEASTHGRPERVLNQQFEEKNTTFSKLCASFGEKDKLIVNSLSRIEGQLARIEDTESQLMSTLLGEQTIDGPEVRKPQSPDFAGSRSAKRSDRALLKLDHEVPKPVSLPLNFGSSAESTRRSGDALLELASIRTQLDGYLCLQLQNAKMTVDRLCASVNAKDERLAESLRQVEGLLAESVRQVQGHSTQIGQCYTIFAGCRGEVRLPQLIHEL